MARAAQREGSGAARGVEHGHRYCLADADSLKAKALADANEAEHGDPVRC